MKSWLYPISLTMIHVAFCSSLAYLFVHVFNVVEPVASRFICDSVAKLTAPTEKQEDAPKSLDPEAIGKDFGDFEFRPEDPVTSVVRLNQSSSLSCATSAVRSSQSFESEMSIHGKFVVKFVLDFDDLLIFYD
ncbi:hypothetical protein U1Q18_012740 [Sarracenia purpurea var. burkii]